MAILNCSNKLVSQAASVAGGSGLDCDDASCTETYHDHDCAAVVSSQCLTLVLVV